MSDDKCIEYKDVKGNRNYKDSVFRELFTSWGSSISLYNAVFSSNLPLNAKVEHLQISNVLLALIGGFYGNRRLHKGRLISRLLKKTNKEGEKYVAKRV